MICLRWHESLHHDEGFWRRLTIFHGRISRISGDDPTVHAVTYPDIVALARLLASAYWMSVAVSGRLRCQQLFAEEMRRTVAPRYEWPQPPGSWDPLFRYLRDLPGPNGPGAFLAPRYLRRHTCLHRGDTRAGEEVLARTRKAPSAGPMADWHRDRLRISTGFYSPLNL
jgi:hypothetical protein